MENLDGEVVFLTFSNQNLNRRLPTERQHANEQIAAFVHHGSDADKEEILEKQLFEWKRKCARLRIQLEVRNS